MNEWYSVGENDFSGKSPSNIDIKKGWVSASRLIDFLSFQDLWSRNTDSRRKRIALISATCQA